MLEHPENIKSGWHKYSERLSADRMRILPRPNLILLQSMLQPPQPKVFIVPFRFLSNDLVHYCPQGHSAYGSPSSLPSPSCSSIIDYLVKPIIRISYSELRLMRLNLWPPLPHKCFDLQFILPLLNHRWGSVVSRLMLHGTGASPFMRVFISF